MSVDEELVAVSITAADADWLAGFTRRLLADRLVACGNLQPAVRSLYRWAGAIADEPEALVTLHTRRAHVHEIIVRADAEHPYDTPQVVAVPVAVVHPGYRDWVLAETEPGVVE
ncbi:divalent-cation tolerance protein CutA [Nocardia sp. NPDC050697]|uniref:divalent-cation tolerance protein CutA n=1 Tax=Nocardia sp. NPDC050697 TaxID=3155158 RepID=UPI0034003952